eukprot:TRINITY_DN738_c0_g1_i2.p1 TRINITY_DN738_c0_g1~~TRINITY_DN738_c0_g1_i2.p1  ORF type:complete len:476 (+),score=102.05 TRINITY_DN738_c0_g1_i2:161-1588(+)
MTAAKVARPRSPGSRPGMVMKRRRSKGPMPELSSAQATSLNAVKAAASPLRPSSVAEVEANPEAPDVGSRRARLRSLTMEDFRAFRDRTIEFADAACVVVGQNSSGKSSIRDALLFLTLDDVELRLDDLIRRGDVEGEAPGAARVSGHFECSLGDSAFSSSIWLRRQVARNGAERRCICSYWVAVDDSSWRRVSEACYATWLRSSLRWSSLRLPGSASSAGGGRSLASATTSGAATSDGALALPQFSFLGACSPEQLLRSLGGMLEQARQQRASGADEGPATLLKRRRSSTRLEAAPVADGARLEAWAARRLDEVYRELTREPTDEGMTEWSEGGQACLRRSDEGDGALTLLTSRQRGGAAVGRGVALKALSDGDRDVCALALLFTMSSLAAGCREELPPFVLMDEPDARLDKSRARAFWRFLASNAAGDRQCIMFSLNNHLGFGGAGHVGGLLELQPDAAGDRPRELEDCSERC